jgi:hypothetical protein
LVRTLSGPAGDHALPQFRRRAVSTRSRKSSSTPGSPQCITTRSSTAGGYILNGAPARRGPRVCILLLPAAAEPSSHKTPSWRESDSNLPFRVTRSRSERRPYVLALLDLPRTRTSHCRDGEGKKRPQISSSVEIECRGQGGSANARQEEAIACSDRIAVHLASR